MCLAIPAQVKEIDGNLAKVDFGGVTREVDVSLVDAKIDDYVIVHAGFAIEILNEEDALYTIDLFKQILDSETEADVEAEAEADTEKEEK